MSSRALRKAQREREEQERLQKLQQEEEEEEEDEVDEAPTQPATRSAFALLGSDDAEEDDHGGVDVPEDDGEDLSLIHI